jgi:hypothetical protein
MIRGRLIEAIRDGDDPLDLIDLIDKHGRPRSTHPVWLTDLPAVVADAGIAVRTWPGWETRSRSSGGYVAVWAIGVHHDASSPSTSTDSACSYCWETSGNRPVGAVYLARDGEVVIGAAGATNTQGKGGPWATTQGVIPVDSGNSYVLSIEAANNGVGEPWPAVQLDAYTRLVAALSRAYRVPTVDVVAHFEWAPDRKIDPAGPPYETPGDVNRRWDMGRFRHDVDAVLEEPMEGTRMLAIYKPSFDSPGYDPAWFVVFWSGIVRRATNADVELAHRLGIPELEIDSPDQYDDLLHVSGSTYPARGAA